MTIIDTNPFDTRFAAVRSLGALHHIWTISTSSKAAGSLLLGISLILYDLLNDDDDEIRNLAAFATTNLLRAQGSPTTNNAVPLLTSHRLARFLAHTFEKSPTLLKEALRRLTATPAPTPLFSIPFEHLLSEARKEDTALFAREKQNLHFDPALDAMYWSRILLSLAGSSSTSSSQINRLAESYVLAGMRHLTDTAGAEEDGVLGWTSKPEVFAVGMRVFCAAEVVLKWGGVYERRAVLEALMMFLDVGRERNVHGLWMEKVERVLEKEVLRMLRGVRASLAVVR